MIEKYELFDFNLKPENVVLNSQRDEDEGSDAMI